MSIVSALIGHTGLVGSNLRSQCEFTDFFRSSDIDQIKGCHYDLIVCAGIQAKKWWANQNEEADWGGITSLLENLKTVSAKQFILISTVDVYPTPSGVDEFSKIDETSNHPYGKHRYQAEELVRTHFENHLIVRLPGLFGNGIKKNVIHDLLNDHELDKINPEGVFQYYFLDCLRADIERALALKLNLLNLASEPIATSEIHKIFFANKAIGESVPFKASYDMKSRYWKEWNSQVPGYLYNKESIFSYLEAFIKRDLLKDKVLSS